MLMKFALLILFITFVNCKTIPFVDRGDDDNNVYELYNQFRPLTPQELADFDEFLSRKLKDEFAALSSGEVVYRNTRRPHQSLIVKRDVLWTVIELFDCARRLKHFQHDSKLDLPIEMHDCYRRIKH